MARKGNGGIGTSCGFAIISAPYMRDVGLSPKEYRQVKAMERHRERMKEDPIYAADIKLKLQLRNINSTTGSYAKAAKRRITLPKFSWDKN